MTTADLTAAQKATRMSLANTSTTLRKMAKTQGIKITRDGNYLPKDELAILIVQKIERTADEIVASTKPTPADADFTRFPSAYAESTSPRTNSRRRILAANAASVIDALKNFGLDEHDVVEAIAYLRTADSTVINTSLCDAMTDVVGTQTYNRLADERGI